MNLMEWEVGIPGKSGVRRTSSYAQSALLTVFQSAWEGGLYKLVMLFPEGT